MPKQTIPKKYGQKTTTVSFKLTDAEKNEVNRVLERRKELGLEEPNAGYRELFLGILDFLQEQPWGYRTD